MGCWTSIADTFITDNCSKIGCFPYRMTEAKYVNSWMRNLKFPVIYILLSVCTLAAKRGWGQKTYVDSLRQGLRSLIQHNKELHSLSESYRPIIALRRRPGKSLTDLIDRSTDTLDQIYLSTTRLIEMELEKERDIRYLQEMIQSRDAEIQRLRSSLKDAVQKPGDTTHSIGTPAPGPFRKTSIQRSASFGNGREIPDQERRQRPTETEGKAPERNLAAAEAEEIAVVYQKKLDSMNTIMRDTIGKFQQQLADSSRKMLSLEGRGTDRGMPFLLLIGLVVNYVGVVVLYLNYRAYGGFFMKKIDIKCLVVQETEQAVIAKALIRQDKGHPVTEMRRFDKAPLKSIIDQRHRVFTLRVRTGRKSKQFIFSKSKRGDESLFMMPGIDPMATDKLINLIKNDEHFSRPPFRESENNI